MTNPIESRRLGAVVDLPLHPSQAWFLEAMLPGLLDPNSWHLKQVVDLPSDATAESARAAAESAWHRHEALRATFHQEGGTWCQRILPSSTPAPFRVVDLSGFAADQREDAVALTATQATNALDIHAGPVVQFVYMATGGRPRLLVVVHHLVCDGFSLLILINELIGGRPPSAIRPAPYGDCVRAIQEYANSPVLLDELPHWTAQRWDDIADLPGCSRERAGDILPPWSSVTVTVEPEIARPLMRGAADRLGQSPEQTSLAVVADAVTAWAGGPVCFRLLMPGRDLKRGADGANVFPPGVRWTVGWFATGALAIVMPRGDLDRAAYTRRVHEWTTAAPNHGVGINLLRWSAAPGAHSPAVKRMWSESALLFNYLGSLPGAAPPQSVTTMNAQSRLPMHVRVKTVAEGLHVMLDYDPCALRHDSIARLAALLTDTFVGHAKDLGTT